MTTIDTMTSSCDVQCESLSSKEVCEMAKIIAASVKKEIDNQLKKINFHVVGRERTLRSAGQ